MKNNIFRNTIIAGTLCSILVVPSFAQEEKMRIISAEDSGIIPISHTFNHWSEAYIDQLSRNYDVESIFKDKDLNAAITVEDFQDLLKATVDKKYNLTTEAMTREEVVNELVQIWANKTGHEVDQIPTIKMIVYSDMEGMTPEYKHSITVAYMKDIAKGRDLGIFAPKDYVTYGEAAILMVKLEGAIEKEKEEADEALIDSVFETKASYEIKDGNMKFDFELINNTNEDKSLQFGSGMQFEVVVENDRGEEVYRYSDGKFFTQAIVFREIEAGGSIKWEDNWDMKGKDEKELSEGKYTATIKILPITEEDQVINEEDLRAVLEFDI